MADSIRRAQRMAVELPPMEMDDLPETLSAEEVEFLRTHIPGYTIVSKLGSGGQAVVYEAIQESTKRRVAIKLLRQGPLSSPLQVARFRREIDVVTQLHHPNIAQIHDCGVVQGQYWFSMDCVQSADPLDHYVVARQLGIHDVVCLMITVIRALGYAHQRGFMHRDIKPKNILVDDEGMPHLVDFGVAKVLNSKNEATLLSGEGLFVGTLPYLSPEQVSDNAAPPDVRSDIYSFGVTLYQLIAGDFPYDVSGSPIAVRDRIISAEPARPLRARKAVQALQLYVPSGELGDDLERVILKSIAKEPERRYQTAFELADDLERWLRGDAVTAKADDYWYNLRKSLRRYRTQVVVAGAFLMLLGVSLVISLSLWQEAERVAYVAQAGLDAVAYNAIGNAARDMDRLDDAVQLFETSLRISDIANLQDSYLLAARFDACTGLASILYTQNKDNRADSLRDTAEVILRRGLATKPHDAFWKWRESILLTLDGRRFQRRGDPEAAMLRFERARNVISDLMAKGPDDVKLLRSLASSLRKVGSCLLDLECHDEALRVHEECFAIHQRIRELVPETMEDGVDAVRCLFRIAKCRGRRSTLDDEALAIAMLDDAKGMLDALVTKHPDHGMERDVKLLQFDITAYYEFLFPRFQRREAVLSFRNQPTESSSVSTGSSSSSMSGSGEPDN